MERRLVGGWLVLGWLLSISAASAQQLGPDAAKLAAARAKGIAFLKTTQAEAGNWSTTDTPGITGLVLYGMLSAGASPDDPIVAKGLKHLESFRQSDGGVYPPKSFHGNYETSISLLAFQAANKDGRYNELLASAQKYVRGVQWDESEGIDQDDFKYGGAGYGRTGDRPDLSNTLFFIDALKATGASADDPAFRKALVFLSRCQNLESEHNQTPFAPRINDGGFYYTPAAGGNSQAGNDDNGGLRSYGSMTYAGLKSMIHAGLAADDKRAKAAFAWIQKHYTIAENPGMGQQGVYYYYQVFGKALAALNLDRVTDADGNSHDWRKELGDHLITAQQANGSWVNPTPRWLEGDPNLATAYALIALRYCDPKPAAAK